MKIENDFENKSEVAARAAENQLGLPEGYVHRVVHRNFGKSDEVDYYGVFGNAHPDFFDPNFQMEHLDVIAHWLVNGIPYAADVRKISSDVWFALEETYPKLCDFVDRNGTAKGIHGFVNGKFYITRDSADPQSVQEPYLWFDDFEVALGKNKSKKL